MCDIFQNIFQAHVRSVNVHTFRCWKEASCEAYMQIRKKSKTKHFIQIPGAQLVTVATSKKIIIFLATMLAYLAVIPEYSYFFQIQEVP